MGLDPTNKVAIPPHGGDQGIAKRHGVALSRELRSLH